MIEMESSSPEETERLAAALAAELQPGDVVTVSGELGSGKTTFVRGACRGGNTARGHATTQEGDDAGCDLVPGPLALAPGGSSSFLLRFSVLTPACWLFW